MQDSKKFLAAVLVMMIFSLMVTVSAAVDSRTWTIRSSDARNGFALMYAAAAPGAADLDVKTYTGLTELLDGSTETSAILNGLPAAKQFKLYNNNAVDCCWVLGRSMITTAWLKSIWIVWESPDLSPFPM